MKKLISITLLCVMLLSAMIVCVQADESEYPGVEIMNSYLEEDINHYFLPVAYDLTRIYNYTDSKTDYTLNECINKVYTELVQKDESGRISTPPLMTVFNNNNSLTPLSGFSASDWFKFYIIELDDPEYEKTLTSAMRRAVSVSVSSNGDKNPAKTVQRAFLAPWTLYDNGTLYTWIDLMAMSEDELNELDFNTPDFAGFISKIKSELEIRGWWKEEYEEKYAILYAHKDDYRNSLSADEDFIFNGETYNFADMYYEYMLDGVGDVRNIISLNFYQKGFSGILKNTSDIIRNKYSDMFAAIESKIESDRFNGVIDGPWFTFDWYIYLYILNDFEIDVSHSELSSTNYMCNIIMYKDNFDLSKIINGVEKFCYETNTSIPQWRIDQFVCGDLRESMLAFSWDNALILNAEKDDVVDMRELLISKENSYFVGKEDRIVDIKYIIEDIKQYMTHLDSYQKEFCVDDISYLESLLDSESPSTGENTALYIAIAGAAVVAMTSLVVRRKKKIT